MSMPKGFKKSTRKFSDILSEQQSLGRFWENYNGKKTLHEVVKHFVNENQNNFDESDLRNFAPGVGNNLIGKNVDERKLVELMLQEIARISPSEVKTSTSKSKASKKLEKNSIFDADRLDGTEFENFMCEVLKANGFTNVEVIGQAGDQGADLLAKKDGEELVIQAKRYSIDRKVTNSAVQEVVASLAYYTRNKGIVVTNSFFTQSAKELAKVNNVELWDRNDVIEFLNGYKTDTGGSE